VCWCCLPNIIKINLCLSQLQLTKVGALFATQRGSIETWSFKLCVAAAVNASHVQVPSTSSQPADHCPMWISVCSLCAVTAGGLWVDGWPRYDSRLMVGVRVSNYRRDEFRMSVSMTVETTETVTSVANAQAPV